MATSTSTLKQQVEAVVKATFALGSYRAAALSSPSPYLPYVDRIGRKAHGQEEEDEARPERRVTDVVALGVEEHQRAGRTGGEERDQELLRRHRRSELRRYACLPVKGMKPRVWHLISPDAAVVSFSVSATL